jgi:hypothetical protein
MRSFTEILTESKKTYEFKMGVAGELPKEFEDTLETSLKKFDIQSIGAGKKTPIQERPLDFPQLQNMEVTYYDVELGYPTTPQVMQEYVGRCCGIDQAYVIVRGANDPREDYQEKADEGPYETLLTTEELKSESAQESAGESRVMELLKELETARKEREHDPAAAAPTEK